ncbi:hypothetical protein IMCC9480_332 [Oxalobacteraceae bacterium IMCC9480]|nr:hypothetical protein IMCC9480_332 [Oxalobacteraceae bacterium IMCC9480]
MLPKVFSKKSRRNGLLRGGVLKAARPDELAASGSRGGEGVRSAVALRGKGRGPGGLIFGSMKVTF